MAVWTRPSAGLKLEGWGREARAMGKQDWFVLGATRSASAERALNVEQS
jgi:hypothetical protein